MYRIKYAECFEEDVIIAYRWYEKINEIISANFLRELHESEEIIEKNPKANARVLGTKTRRYHLPTFPYKIFYKKKKRK